MKNMDVLNLLTGFVKEKQSYFRTVIRICYDSDAIKTLLIAFCLCLSDIKPENLLISSEDVLKLCDFGESLVLHCLQHSFCHIKLRFTLAI